MKDRYINVAIALVSIAIPLVIASLFYLKPVGTSVGFDLKILPALNASLNFTTAILLLVGHYFIKRDHIRSHRLCMLTAFGLSALFLISYVTYHSMATETHYGGEGIIRYIYFFILISHILLAATIVPLVLITLIHALRGRFHRHKKIARWTYPLWLYVAITGVIVYLMLRPYY
jgi:putative membrane protein